MRTSSDLVKEILSLAAPSLSRMVNQPAAPYNHSLTFPAKEALLKQQDADMPKITAYFKQIPEDNSTKSIIYLGDSNLL